MEEEQDSVTIVDEEVTEETEKATEEGVLVIEEEENDAKKELDRAVAAIIEDETIVQPFVQLGDRVDLDVSSIATSDSPVGEEDEPRPLAKRRRIIISEDETSSESDFPNLTRTSTPKSIPPAGIKRQQPYDPRRVATLPKPRLLQTLSRA